VNGPRGQLFHAVRTRAYSWARAVDCGFERRRSEPNALSKQRSASRAATALIAEFRMLGWGSTRTWPPSSISADLRASFVHRVIGALGLINAFDIALFVPEKDIG